MLATTYNAHSHMCATLPAVVCHAIHFDDMNSGATGFTEAAVLALQEGK